MLEKLLLEVVSDVVCPWCYVGKRRLERALNERPDIDVDIIWRPFQLTPDMAREGRLRSEHYSAIFGTERAEQIMSSMQETGRDEGIAFGSSPDAMSPNTLAAHVLMQWATEAEHVDASVVAEKLFAAHHVDCEDLGDRQVLARIAGEVGMDADDIAARLAAHQDEDRVRAVIDTARGRGVTGVPFFIINGRYGLSGAQPAEVLLQAIDQVLNEDGEPVS
jgi:predicted DsbA family dithiol-disulfide isomerase